MTKTDFFLSEISEIFDCEHKTAPIDYTGGFYSIRTTDISNGRINYEIANRVSFQTYQEWTKRAKPQRNDIILAREAPVGEVGFVKTNDDLCLGQRTVLIKPNPTSVIPDFLLYYLVNSETKNDLISRSTGSVVQHLNVKDIRNFKILLPPLPEQRAIASVLSSLDDKIDLLHRQNKTLESMAETLFRQLFVEEADEEWEEDSLLKYIDLIGGGTPKTENPLYWNGAIPWLAGGDIASNHKSFVQTAEKMITEFGLNNSSAKLIPKYSTVISARGTVGKYCMLSEPMAFSQSNYGVLPKIDNCFFFTYLLINHVVEELQSSAYGSVFDTITTNTFRDIKVIMPAIHVINKFEMTISPYFNKMLHDKGQIRTLESLRDTLLPKLMSGEVRVQL